MIFLYFKEYEAGETAEAKFVKDMDRFDMILQAFEYEQRDNCPKKHQEFFDSTDGKIANPLMKDLVEELKKQREAHQLEDAAEKVSS